MSAGSNSIRLRKTFEVLDNHVERPLLLELPTHQVARVHLLTSVDHSTLPELERLVDYVRHSWEISSEQLRLCVVVRGDAFGTNPLLKELNSKLSDFGKIVAGANKYVGLNMCIDQVPPDDIVFIHDIRSRLGPPVPRQVRRYTVQGRRFYAPSVLRALSFVENATEPEWTDSNFLPIAAYVDMFSCSVRCKLVANV